MKSKIYQYRYFIRDVLFITAGSISLALGLVFFLIQNKIATGGVAGLAIVMHYLTDLPTGMVMLVLNIPLLLLGFK